MNIQEL